MTFLNHHNNSCLVTLPSPSDSAESDKLQSKLEALEEVQKLCEFYENLKSVENNPTNILNNLCTGLESFLGFNSASKGYDGTGIVYSDLDRLCDAVMGFLSGVLSNIKEHLGQHKNTLDSAIESLNDNKHAGKIGFNAAIERVVEGVGGYNDKVREGNESINRHMTELITQSQQLRKEVVSSVYKRDVDAMDSKVSDYLKKVEAYAAGMRSQKDDIRDLKKDLQVMVNRADENIKYQARQLKINHEHQKADLKAVEKKVVDALRQAKQNIDTHIQEDVEELIKMLKEKVQKVLDDLMNISKSLLEYVRVLGLWIQKADQIVRQAINDAEYIIDEKPGKTIQTQIKDGAFALIAYRDRLCTNIDSVKKELDTLVKNAENKFVIIKNGVIAGNSRHGNVDPSIEHNWKQLRSTIGVLVEGLTKKGQNNPACLADIVEKVRDYAKTYGQEFSSTVTRWVGEIMRGDAVKGLLSRYFTTNDRGSLFQGSLRGQNEDEVLKVLYPIVQGHIIRGLWEIRVREKSGTSANVDENLGEITQYLRSYAEQVARKHTEVVEGIEFSLQESGKFGLQKGSSDKTDLQAAIQSALAAVKSAAEGAAKEIDTFRQKSNITNLTQAISNVKSIGTHINGRSLGNAGGNIDTALGGAKSAINDLGKFLDKSGADGSIKQKIDLTNVDETTQELIAASDRITKNLTHLTKAYADAADVVKQKLLGLKLEKIGKTDKPKVTQGSLQDLHNKLRTLGESNLQNVIRDAKAFVSGADRAGEQTIALLKKHVGLRIEEAQTAVTKEIKTKYILYITSLLTAFADKVADELKRLPKEITKDADKGCKGFMGQLQLQLGSSKLGSLLPEDATLSHLSAKVSTFFMTLLGTLRLKPDILPKPRKIPELTASLSTLLGSLSKYNQEFVTNLASLNTLLGEIRIASSTDANNQLIEILTTGFTALHVELDKAYVSVYDEGIFIEDLTKTESKKQKDNKPSETITVLTDYGRKYSKVCLTVFSILRNALHKFKRFSNSNWKTQKMLTSTDLGAFLCGQGYIVSDEDTRQNGELQNAHSMNGWHIYKVLVGKTDKYVYNSEKNVRHPLENMYIFLNDYYQLSHLLNSSSKRQPSSVCDILVWLSGLPCNTVYEEMLGDAISELFVDPSKQPTFDDEIAVTVVSEDPMAASPIPITYDDTRRAVERLCSKSYDVLVRILGYGDAYTMYAVDFGNNALNFHYPSKAGDCLQMLIDMLRRLLPPLRFLHSQCKLGAEFHGWSECFYGKEVRTTKWTCTDHSSDEATCQPNCQPNCRPNDKPSCEPKSPLMSYLSDCLLGHLPHSLTSIGCNPKCSTCLKGQPGQSCLTPLGFRGFSGSTKTGKNLCDILDEFFNNEHLLSLFTLSPRPPATLAEYFSFAMRHFGDWQQSNPAGQTGLQSAFENSIEKLSIDQPKDDAQLRIAFRDIYGSKKANQGSASSHPDDNHVDMVSLCLPNTTTTCSGKDIHCAPYLYNLYCDSYHYLAEKNSDLYLSWAVYLPWNLWYNLESLLNEFCNIFCADWGCRRCLTGDRCKKGKHGDKYSCHCSSIVKCKGVSPTLYKYGFTFANPSTLHTFSTRRTCYSFAQQLNKVIYSKYFTKLFEQCDNFLFTIRSKFFWTTVALWSLSLFYLICVMVGRLDVLHIRSHLKIPSSHKITAQSLLAAAQVGRLAKISYLQP